MKLYRTGNGTYLEHDGSYYRVPEHSWDALVTHGGLHGYLQSILRHSKPVADLLPANILAPIAGRRVDTVTAVGDPVDALIACGCEQPGACLTVVGTRGLGMVRRLFLGSVSTKLLHSGHGALLVVPEHETATG